MPTYSYKCPTCNKVYDIKHKISELSKSQICKVCGSTMVRQLNVVKAIEINGIESTASQAKWRDSSGL